MITSTIGFIIVLVLVLLRMPIAIAMGVVGIIGYGQETTLKASISMAGRLIIDTAQDYGLSVVPLFILMGLFVNKGGLRASTLHDPALLTCMTNDYGYENVI